MKITVFRDFSFGASNVVPVHDTKASEGVQFLCVIHTVSECRRCVTLSDLTDIYPSIGRIHFLTFYPEIGDYFA
jgi:hypothetical protein